MQFLMPMIHSVTRRVFLQQINDNVGYVKVMASCGGAVEEYAEKLLCRSWEKYTQWQADVLNYLIKANDYEMVFSPHS